MKKLWIFVLTILFLNGCGTQDFPEVKDKNSEIIEGTDTLEQDEETVVYEVAVDGIPFEKDGTITVANSSFVFQYAERLSEQVVQKQVDGEDEFLSGNWNEHILNVSENYQLSGRDGTIVSTIEYQFQDILRGTEVRIEITEELAARIGVSSNILKIIVEY